MVRVIAALERLYLLALLFCAFMCFIGLLCGKNNASAISWCFGIIGCAITFVGGIFFIAVDPFFKCMLNERGA